MVPGASIGATALGHGWLFVPGSSRLNGQVLNVRACGSFQAPGSDATSPAVTIGLYAAKNLTATANPSNQVALNPDATISALATYQEAAGTPGIVPVPWKLTAEMNADTGSGILQGSYTIQIDNGSVQSGSITSLSGVDMSQPIPLGFLIGVTFSAAGSGNTASMFQFDLQA